MEHSKLRRQIAWEAARLMYDRHESEYYRAKMKAARRLCKGWVKPADLPSNVEIRDNVRRLAQSFEGDRRDENLLQMRLAALRIMKLLERFRPRLIGSVLTGHIRKGSDIDLHVFSDSAEAVALVLEDEGIPYELQRKQVRKHGEQRWYTHLHLHEEFPIEITVYALDKLNYVFKSSITGKAMERASISELESLLADEYAGIDVETELGELNNQVDRFQLYESLLWPLEQVKQSPKYHPEGDALYHSLQVFDLARDELPYDEEFLTAALLHDVGKAIDRHDHVAAGLQALEGFITERTAWLIEFHMQGQEARLGTLGVRAHRRLRQSESYDELLLLARCDQEGRQVGVQVPDVHEALDYLRELDHLYGH